MQIPISQNSYWYLYYLNFLFLFFASQVFIIIKYFFEQYINLRQIRLFLIKETPEDIQAIGISDKQFKRGQKFYYDKLYKLNKKKNLRAFEMYVKSIKTALEVITIICQIMPFIWEKLVPFLGLNPRSEVNFYQIEFQGLQFQRGLAFILAEALRSKLIDVPNSLYKTLVIERRYNLNQSTFFLFFKDIFIETFLQCMVVPVFLYGYLHVVERGGEYFFFFGMIYPNYIAPLFNKFEELPHGSLRTRINNLSESIKFPLTQILVMDGSRRSDHSNAYFFGQWKNKRIVLYDTLLQKLNDDEVISVVGHELGHWKYRHAYINVFIYMIRILIIFYIFSFFRNEDSVYLSFGFKEKSVKILFLLLPKIFIGSVLFFVIFDVMNQVLNLCELIVSRFFEFQADFFAYKLGFGQWLMSGLVKLNRQNSTNLMVDPLYAWYYNSHPTLFERLNYLSQLKMD